MQVDWWTLAFQTVNVLVLVWLLGRFLFRPVADMVARRQAEVDGMIADAEAARNGADAARAAAEAEARTAAVRRGELMKAAEAEAQAHKEALLDEAREAASALRASAEEELKRAREQAEQDAGSRARLLSVDIAAKLMERLPDETRISPFVPGLARGIEALAQADREALEAQAGRGPLPVLVPREPTGDEMEACEAALAPVLGAGIKLKAEVEPALLAGLEIRGDGAVVRNSLRADLETIASELARHG